jgi:hypothetical protein
MALFLNGLLALTLLGIPYLRGRLRAREAVAGFAELARCVYGGRIPEEPGLALPAGDREHFAARVERAGPTWPTDCVEILHRLRPQPAIFLFPSSKQAEEDLRRAIDLAEGEFVALHRVREAARGGRGVGAVPERPLRAMTQLRAALANLLTAADVAVDSRADAIVLDPEPTVVEPSRVPLETASGGALRVRPEPGGLRAIATDARSIAEVVVREGSTELVRVRRPTAVRGILLGPEGGYPLWLTSEATCAQDEARCRNRLLGIGRLRADERELRPRAWLAAHPFGRVDRSVRIGAGGEVWVIALAETGGIEALRFALEPGAERPAQDGPITPRVAIERRPIGVAVEALLVEGGAIAVLPEGQGVRVRGVGIPETAGAIALPEGRSRLRQGEAVLARCGAWTALGMPHGVAVIAPGGVLGTTLARELREPVLGAAPGDDAIRLVCTDQGADVIALDRRRRVVRWACTPDRCADEPDVLAEGALAFDAAHAAGVTLVAWSGGVQHPQIRVRRVRGDVIGAPEVPAPCWDSGQGMCGAPIVVAEGAHLLVVAREGADLRVLEMAESGWRRLPRL